jgi:hypothetical protein
MKAWSERLDEPARKGTQARATPLNAHLRKYGEMTMDMNMLLFELALPVIVGIVLVGIFRRS